MEEVLRVLLIYSFIYLFLIIYTFVLYAHTHTPLPHPPTPRFFHFGEWLPLESACARQAIRARLFPPVCWEEIGGPRGGGELQVWVGGSDAQRDSYPAATSLVICDELFFSLFLFF